jgi:hypothetical protein
MKIYLEHKCIKRKTAHKMDNVTARINQGYLLLPNPALMSSSGAAISRAMAILSPVIMDERVVQFINSIRQQDMRTELLKIFWAAKASGADTITEDHMITNRTYLTSISFLLSSPGIPHPDMIKMFDEVDRIFNAAQEENIRAEAADIMHRFYPVRGERMLDELRHVLNIGQPQIPHDNEEVIRMIQQRQQPEQQDRANAPLQDLRRLRRLAAVNGGVNKKVIYDDSQNVHNTTINESVIAAARSLIEEMIATVTFDGRYKFNVFRGDTVTSITNRLADVLKRFPEDVTILGDGDKQELQPRMTYRISKDAKSTIEVSRFNPDEVDRYMEVIGMEDYIFPNNVVRDGDLGRRLEEIFLVTNRCITSVFEDKAEEELLFYLDLCGIPDAEMIWFEREEILKDLYVVIGNERQRDEDINEFLDEIFDDIFPDREMGSFIRRIKTSSVRDIKLLDLLNAVWKFIHTKQGETFTEMKKRLREEILEGMEVCTSGVCAHLVSVIQGYFDEDKQPSLKIKMSLVDELQARLTQNINALAMEREVDPVMESDNFKKLIDEYVDMNAKDILDGFTDDDIRMSGLSKQMIIDVAYRSYRIGENMGEDVPDTAP